MHIWSYENTNQTMDRKFNNASYAEFKQKKYFKTTKRQTFSENYKKKLDF